MQNTAFFEWLSWAQGKALLGTANAAAAMAVYVVIGNLILRTPYSGRAKAAVFAVFNFTAVYFFFFHGSLVTPLTYQREPLLLFGVYAVFGSAHWLLVRVVAGNPQSSLRYLVSLLYPIVPLVVVKIEPTWLLVGFSYMAFRMAYTAFEVRRNPGLDVSFSGYAAFLFFPLTIPIGPISPYSYFRRGLEDGAAPDLLTIARGGARIALGYVMFRYLATIAFQISFAGIWEDGFRHGVGDLLIAAYGTLAYLYFNFAGFTHVVIGASALLGIPVRDNFDSPVLSLSIKEFWTRWHITLSQFVRDLVYTPLTITVTRRLGASFALPVSLGAAMVTFTIIGLWHEFTFGFLLFGLAHGAGFSANSLFEYWTRKSRKDRLDPFFRHPAWKMFSWLLTMTYVALTMVVTEFSSVDQLSEAWSVLELRW